MKEKNVGGRPRLYNSAEEIQEIIQKYFENCKINNKPYTMSGLADALDMSRQSLLNYSKDERFFDTIMRARRKVEVFTEEKLFEKETCNGSKFSLSNNFGWTEKQEIEHHIDKLEDIL